MEKPNTKDADLKEREQEATEEETLKDLEDSFGSSEPNKQDNKNVPSPDGSFDEDKELDQADPM